MKRSLFITIEGPDGAGLSTQASLLSKWFKNENKRVFLTKEPTNNLIGGIVRTVLKNEWAVDMNTLALLFTADRSHHVSKEVLPLLDKGVNVVCDRYVLSTLAFEGCKADIEWLKQLNSKFPEPDFTFILDVPGKVCVERIRNSRTSMEFFEDVKKLEMVRENYKKLKGYFDNTFIIKGYDRTPKQISQEIVKIIKGFKIL